MGIFTQTHEGLNFISTEANIQYDGSDIVTFLSSGNVGIGTTSPTQKLHVSGNIYSSGTLYVDTVRSATGSDIIVSRDDSSKIVRLGSGDADDKVYIYAGGGADPKVYVGTNGNVGIGTTSPIAKQHNVITSNGTALLLNNTSGGSGEYVDLDFNTYNTSLANYANAAASIRVIDDGLYSGHITFRTKGSTIGASQTERMRITSSGNVGIGTTSPDSITSSVATLSLGGTHATASGGVSYQVNGSVKFYQYVDNDSLFVHQGQSGIGQKFKVNGSEAMRITSGGNVGIGTTSPLYKLDVSSGNSSNAFGLSLSGTERLKIYADSSNNFFEAKSGQSFKFTTTGGASFNILNGGNVGIGTTSPATSLDITKVTPSVTTFFPYLQLSQRGTVANSKTGISFRNTEYNWDMGKISTERSGASNSFDFVIYTALSGADNERMRITSAGNVGIGTSSPNYKLDVSGTARAVKSKIDITPTSDTIALDIRGTGTPNDYFTVSNATGGANDVFLPIFFYKAATYGYNGGTNRYPSGVYGGGFVAAVDDTSYPNAAGAGAAMHFNARTYANNGPLTNRYLFSWGSWLTTHMAMTAGGNLLIGKTTDSGEELQVNGSTDVSGDINADGDFYQNGTQGWSGTINIPTNPPVTITVQGGIITNVT